MKKIFFTILAGAMPMAQTALAECTLNGEVIPCDQMPKWPFGIMVGVFLLAMVSLVFWVMMLVDVAKNEKDNDLIIWLLVLFFFGVIGAIVYYFAKKLPRKKTKNNK